MATIGKIRRNSGIVLILIGLAMLGFILTDLFRSGRLIAGEGGPKGVGQVYGEEISHEEFQDKLSRAIEGQRAQNGSDQDVSPAMEGQLNDQLWNEFISERIINKEAAQLGLEVTGEEIIDLCIGDNPHFLAQQALPKDKQGRLDRRGIQQFLANFDNAREEDRMHWKQFEDYLTAQRLKEKFLGLVKGGMYVTDLEAQEDFIAHNQTASIQYVPLFTSSISDSVAKISDSEIKDYYNKHKEDFKRDESRNIQYVAFDITAQKADTAAAELWLVKQKEAFRNTKNDSSFVTNVGRGRYNNTFQGHGSFPAALEDQLFSADTGAVLGPYYDNGAYKLYKVVAKKADSVYYYNASHILIKPEGNTNADTNKAFQKAKDVYNQIKKGSDFSALAKEKSQDPSNASNGGSLGWFKEGMMVKPFNDAVKKGSKGEIIGPVKTQFGSHIIKINENKSNTLIKVAVLERPVEVGRQTRDKAYTLARQFLTLAPSGDQWDEAAKKMKIDPRVAENLKPGDRTVQGLGDARELIRWAYGTDIKVNTISSPIEINGKYVIALLSRINEEGYAPFEDIKKEVTVLAKNEKKKQMLADKLNEAKAKNKTIEAIASAVKSNASNADNVSFANPYLPNISNAPELVGTVYGLKPNQISDAIMGDNAAFIVKVISFSNLQLPQKFDTDRNRLREGEAGRNDDALTALKKAAKVKDYRYIYY